MRTAGEHFGGQDNQIETIEDARVFPGELLPRPAGAVGTRDRRAARGGATEPRGEHDRAPIVELQSVVAERVDGHSGGVTSQTTGSKASRFAFLRSFSTKGSQALLGQQNSLVSLDSYAFPTHEKSVTLSAATTRSKMAAMKLRASEGDGDEDALSPV